MKFKRLVIALLLLIGWIGLMRSSLMLMGVRFPPLHQLLAYDVC